jgi:hypothetical protein
VTVPEGNAGDEAFASLDVTVSPVSERAVSVGYSTSDGTATTADGDYEGGSGTVDFAPGETVHTILVKVIGDDAAELDETFDVDISGPVHATLGNATGVVTVANNDPIPPLSAVLSVSGASVREGKAGTTTVLSFTVTRSGELGTAVGVDVATSNGTATAVEDYVAATNTLAFGVGETTKTLDVTVNGDRRLEHAETFFLTLLGQGEASAAARELRSERGRVRGQHLSHSVHPSPAGRVQGRRQVPRNGRPVAEQGRSSVPLLRTRYRERTGGTSPRREASSTEH